ncbi:MAG: hypothetical protein PWQ60_541 [Thermoanaerobacteraceae bacterium]|nr:hypothetical protein [Thermoanaerobacteraceae bacterium]MDN5313415.1 hypothetical protein [Thermoanaerobacteraceae bacterium]RKL62394.1 FadR family transcriptional regulator [Thermoanaerobacteraceae bacterium SP2]
MAELDQQLDYEILKELLNSREPLGAVNLSIILGEKYGVSQATIGRRLLQMDHAGYTKKLKNMGRILTQKGIEHLSALNNKLSFENAKKEFLESISPSNISDLIDILIARRGLEKEAAFLAAKNADEDIINQMQEVLLIQKTKISQGISGDNEDREFHRLIAVASKNKVLLRTIMLLREQNDLTRHFATVRKAIGGKLYDDHVRILEMIKAKDSRGAYRAIESHLNKMIKEFQNYIIQK